MANNYKQYKKAKKEKNLADKGIALGGTAAAIGGGFIGAAKLFEKYGPEIEKLEAPTVNQIKEAASRGKALAAVSESITPEKLKSIKNVGKWTAAAGGSLAGVSAYKHYKAKKKLKELEGNDSKKK